MLVKVLGVVLICVAGLATYAAFTVGTSLPIVPEDVGISANGTRILAIGAGALFIGGMMAILRR